MTDDEQEAWIAQRPPRVQAVARRYPGFRGGKLVCYRSTQNPRFHYTIYSIGEPEDPDAPCTLTLIHGADSTLPGVSTFGQPPEQLIECGCGHWEWPTAEQRASTHAYMMRMRNERNER